MTRPLPLPRLTLGLLALVACNETTAPTQPGTERDLKPSASLFFPSGSWAGLPQPEQLWRFDLAAGVYNTATNHSTVYVLGGRYEQNPTDVPATTILAFDVDAKFWTTKAAHFSGAETNGIGNINGTLYISGGADFTGQPSQWKTVSPKLFAYDPVRDRVVRKADMPRATARGVTGVIQGKLFVLAGNCLEGSCRRFFRYDPLKNVWTTLPSPPHSHRNGAGVVVNSKFYVAGGGFSPFTAFDVYDPATNAWRTLTPLPSARQFAVGAPVASKVYVVGIEGGDREGSVTADRSAFVYSPTARTWTNLGGFPGPVGEFGQFLLHPAAAVRVWNEGSGALFTVGAGHLFADSTFCPPCKPNGTIEPTLNYLYTP